MGLVAVLLLAGCSSTSGEDKFSADYMRTHVIPHQTTQAQVQQLYGVPDDQDSNSEGESTWIYDKGGNLSSASSLAGYIPGAGAISSALGMASSASSASDAASTASNKMSNNTAHHGNTLFISFDKNKVVSRWHM